MNEALARMLREVSERAGTPCYVYSRDLIRVRVADFRQSFRDRLSLSYAMKANPNRELVGWFADVVEYLDVSSAGEIATALNVGWHPRRMSFTGPGKRDAELEFAVRVGVGEIVVESVDEAESVNRIADAYKCNQGVLIRLAPERVPSGFGVKMAGRPSQFGIDESEADSAIRRIQRMANLTVVGLHAFSGTQCLDVQALLENYRTYLDLFKRTAIRHSLSPYKCVMGSGIGIPYHEGELGIHVLELARGTLPLMDDVRACPIFAQTEFVFESGRFLVGEAGFFLTKVIRVKSSHGVAIAVCDGGMNNNLGACGLLGTVIRRNYPMSVLTEDAHTRRSVRQQVVGPLCTSIDLLGHNIELPALQPGDLIAVECSGAYGLSASPVNFISHPLPQEVVIDR